MTAFIERREFVRLLGGAAAAWPVVVGAQQPTMPIIGFLGSASPAPFAQMTAAFHQGLKEVGYVDDQNVTVEHRWAEGHCERLPSLAADLVQRRVAVIFASGGVAPTQAAKAATATIPIVFTTAYDPVMMGLVVIDECGSELFDRMADLKLAA